MGEVRLHLSEVKHYRNRRVAQEGGGERNETLRDDPRFADLASPGLSANVIALTKRGT